MNFARPQLMQEFEAAKNELNISRRKLDSKCEALLILTKDLDVCRQERDQFKLMAEQVQARYQNLKRQLAGVGPRQTALDGAEFAGMKQQNLAQLICEMREVNKVQQFEVDDLKQKLSDARGDIKLLREQIARHRVGTTDEGINTRHFPAHEREDLVKQLEEAREQFVQIERDLQQVLDEKEELVTERDVYKNKYDRLNSELNLILKGDEKRIVDIDALSMENKYLQERIKQMEEEKGMAMATVSKYKNILERKKNKGIIRLGQSRSGGVVVSQKQVQQLLENKSALTPTPKMMADLQSLATALLETLNDKNTALSHQRKTNKILGTRVSELEKKLRTLEVAGLWNVPGLADAAPLTPILNPTDLLQSAESTGPDDGSENQTPTVHADEGDPTDNESDTIGEDFSAEQLSALLEKATEKVTGRTSEAKWDLEDGGCFESSVDEESEQNSDCGKLLLNGHDEKLELESMNWDSDLLEDNIETVMNTPLPESNNSEQQEIVHLDCISQAVSRSLDVDEYALPELSNNEQATALDMNPVPSSISESPRCTSPLLDPKQSEQINQL